MPCRKSFSLKTIFHKSLKIFHHLKRKECSKESIKSISFIHKTQNLRNNLFLIKIYPHNLMLKLYLFTLEDSKRRWVTY